MSKRVLLVDDEVVLRGLVSSVLEAAGYSVVSKESAEEVMEFLEQESFPFDIVITDVQLVSMDGTELARNIREHAPGVPVLLTTGYGSAASEEFPVLSKPFRPVDLLRAIEDLAGA